ncbi:hypothetical protein Tco_1374529, partial [Tanacetum coccineum]
MPSSHIKGLLKIKGQKGQSKGSSTRGQSCASSNAPYWSKPSKEDTVANEEAQGSRYFTLQMLTKQARKGHITDCHAGNPCVHICDPTSQSRYPMIGMNKGWRLKGACKSAQALE